MSSPLSICVSPKEARDDEKPARISCGGGDDNDEGDEWEWVWEDEDNEEQDEPDLPDEEKEEEAMEDGTDTGKGNGAPPQSGSPSQLESPLTAEKLEKVKDIIEKPEERWRILWQKSRTPGSCDTPSSASSARS